MSEPETSKATPSGPVPAAIPAPATQPAAVPQIPEEVYVTMAGVIDTQLVQRAFNLCAQAVNANVKRVHLLLQSLGGNIEDGVVLYNYLRKLPLELITYNGGSVASAAVLPYLAGKTRRTSKSATFTTHKITTGFNVQVGMEQLRNAADRLSIEDTRSEQILREHVVLTQEQWQIHERGNLTLTAEEGVKVGLAHEVADFSPPAGSRIVNLIVPAG